MRTYSFWWLIFLTELQKIADKKESFTGTLTSCQRQSPLRKRAEAEILKQKDKKRAFGIREIEEDIWRRLSAKRSVDQNEVGGRMFDSIHRGLQLLFTRWLDLIGRLEA